MTEVESGGSDLLAAIENYTAGLETGNYRTNVDTRLHAWVDWLRRERGVDRVEDVEVLDCRRYAATLKRQARDGDIASTTARTYYAYVRSFTLVVRRRGARRVEPGAPVARDRRTPGGP